MKKAHIKHTHIRGQHDTKVKGGEHTTLPKLFQSNALEDKHPEAQMRGKARPLHRKKHQNTPARSGADEPPRRPARKYLEDTLRAVLTAVRAQASQGWVKLQERRHSAVLNGSAGGDPVEVSAEAAALSMQQKAGRYSTQQ